LNPCSVGLRSICDLLARVRLIRDYVRARAATAWRHNEHWLPRSAERWGLTAQELAKRIDDASPPPPPETHGPGRRRRISATTTRWTPGARASRRRRGYESVFCPRAHAIPVDRYTPTRAARAAGDLLDTHDLSFPYARPPLPRVKARWISRDRARSDRNRQGGRERGRGCRAAADLRIGACWNLEDMRDHGTDPATASCSCASAGRRIGDLTRTRPSNLRASWWLRPHLFLAACEAAPAGDDRRQWQRVLSACWPTATAGSPSPGPTAARGFHDDALEDLRAPPKMRGATCRTGGVTAPNLTLT